MEKTKKTASSPIVDAFFIGFLVGIVIYSLATNAWGFLTLIPLFLIYALLKRPRRNGSPVNGMQEPGPQ